MRENPFRLLEHPSDVGIEARGTSAAEAFQNAARGLMSVMVDPATVRVEEARSVHVAASDLEQLLVRWLAEILYLFDGERFTSAAFLIHSLTDTTLDATVRGERFSPARHVTRTDVKAVTYHQLDVRRTTEETVVKVFLDI